MKSFCKSVADKDFKTTNEIDLSMLPGWQSGYCAGLEPNARKPVDLRVRMGSNPIPGAKISQNELKPKNLKGVEDVLSCTIMPSNSIELQ